MKLNNDEVLSGLYTNTLLYVIALIKYAILVYLCHYANYLLASEEFEFNNFFLLNQYIFKKVIYKVSLLILC